MDSETYEVIQQWRTAMTVQELSHRTIEERVRIIFQFLRQTGVSPINADAETIVTWLRQFAHPSTRHSYYVNLHAFYVFMNRFDYRPDNPLVQVIPPKRPKSVPRPVTRDQISTVLSSDKCYSMTKHKILFGALAGLRAHEIAKLAGSAYNRDANLLTVIGKGGRTDVIPLHPSLASLASVLPRRGYWFPRAHDKSKHVTGKSVSEAISGAFHRCGIDATAHQLRHYFATSLLQAGVDARTVQTLMRHESLATTAIYMQVSTDQQFDALRALPPLTQGKLF